MKDVFIVILFLAFAMFVILPLLRRRTAATVRDFSYIRDNYIEVEAHLVGKTRYHRQKGRENKSSLVPKSFVAGRYEYYTSESGKKYVTRRVEAVELPYTLTLYYNPCKPSCYYIEGLSAQKSSALSGFIYVALLIADLALCRLVYSLF